MAVTPKVYTTTEICAMFKISRNRVARFAKEGKLVRVMYGRYTIESAEALLLGGLSCPHCQASLTEARLFRTNRGSGLPVYRCRSCQGVYTLYSRTIFEGAQLLPTQVVLLLRGVFQGQSSAQLARELELTEKTVLKWRHRLHDRAEAIQPDTPLPDRATESDEMFQNAGEKKLRAFRPGRSAALSSQ